jgi:ceramide glucosyltransferase
MNLLIHGAAAFCMLAALIHVVSIPAVVWRVRRRGPRASGPGLDEGVSIVRPVCGLENFAEATLTSAFGLEGARYEIIFCVAHGNDPVVPLVRHLIETHPDISARLLIGNDPISTNPKLNNLVKGWDAAIYPWVVMADSNVLLPRDLIPRMMARWQPGTGLVCTPPLGCAPDGIWAELECTFLNTYQARWQICADNIGLGFAQGKTMLWRKDILESAGGIRTLASEVAEDAAATKLLRKRGLRVRLIDDPLLQPLGHRNALEVWNRQLRWARLRRASFRSFYLPEVLAGGVPPLAACAIFAAAADWPVASTAGVFATLWYAAEALLAYAAGWHMSWRSPLLWLLRDLMLPVLWVASWIGSDFVWRGNAMRVAERTRAS